MRYLKKKKPVNCEFLLHILAAVFIVTIFMTCCPSAAGDASNLQKTVKVAYPIQQGLTDIDQQGNRTGYTYDYLQEVAQYTGWSYEFVQVPGTLDEQLAALMDMVKSGEVDLLGSMLYSEQMDQEYAYSGYSYGTVETVLQGLKGEANRVVMDSQTEQTFRIAIRASAKRSREELLEYCKINRITPDFVECASDDEMLQALQDGRADLLLNSSLNYLEEVRTVAGFSPKPYYFITSKNNTNGLMAELNAAISSIKRTDPYFQTTLFEKYFTSQTDEFYLSPEEEAHISEIGTLKVGVYPMQPPFQYKDEKTGELKGISLDILRYYADKIGLQYTVLEASSMEQLYQLASAGEIDIIACMPYDYATAGKQNLAMTRPYITSQYILLMNEMVSEDNIQGKRLAMPKTSTYEGYYVGNVIWYSNLDDCVRAVREGRADYTYVDTYTAQYYLDLPGFENMKMIPQTYDPRQVCFGIARLGDRTLLNLLNMAIVTIPMEDLQSIIYSNIVHQQELTIKNFLQKYPVQILLIVAGIFLVIVALLTVILIQRVRSGRSISFELQKHMRLYAVSNDYLFEFNYKNGELLYNAPNEQDKRRAQSIRLDLTAPHSKPPEQNQSQIVAFLDVLRNAKDDVREIYLYCIDGKWHWLRITVEILRDASGTPIFAIGKFTVIDEEKMEKENLMEKAQRDSLTHLYNNETSRQLVAGRLAELKDPETGALLLLDIDYFKYINDTYGHMRGDQILQEVAALLQNCVSTDAIVARPGGDEFLVYQPAVQDAETLTGFCIRLCDAVHQIHVDADRSLTVSIGAALSHANQDYESLYQAVDQALYAVKNAGRNGFQVSAVPDFPEPIGIPVT